jgi:hypothetical protein
MCSIVEHGDDAMSPTEEAAAKLAASRTSLSPPLGRNASEQMVLQPQQEQQLHEQVLQQEPSKLPTQADVLTVLEATSASEAARSSPSSAKLSSGGDSPAPPAAGFQSLLQPALAPGAPAPPSPMRQLDANQNRFLSRVMEHIDLTLTEASRTVGKAREQFMQSLFNDISTDIEDEVVESLQFSGVRPCYYELLSECYRQREDAFNSAYEKCIVLWNNVYHPLIFAALFHRTVFGPETVDSLKNINELRRGANRLFWLDLRRKTRRFYPVYRFLKEEVLLRPVVRWPYSFVEISLVEIFRVVSRFLFYYEGALAYKPFLDDVEAAKATHRSAKHEQRDTSYMASSFFSRSIMDTSLRDMFTAELASHIEVLKDETILLSYLHHCRVLQGVRYEDRMTVLKLQSLFYNLSNPGGPLYPTRQVRTVADEVCRQIFPKGFTSRRLVRIMFAMLHPWYATKDFVYQLGSVLQLLFFVLTFWIRLIPLRKWFTRSRT